jgi:hypothetical protein
MSWQPPEKEATRDSSGFKPEAYNAEIRQRAGCTGRANPRHIVGKLPRNLEDRSARSSKGRNRWLPGLHLAPRDADLHICGALRAAGKAPDSAARPLPQRWERWESLLTWQKSIPEVGSLSKKRLPPPSDSSCGDDHKLLGHVGADQAGHSGDSCSN